MTRVAVATVVEEDREMVEEAVKMDFDADETEDTVWTVVATESVAETRAEALDSVEDAETTEQSMRRHRPGWIARWAVTKAVN